MPVIVRVSIEHTPAGDRLSVYTGRDEENLRLAGIPWANREHSAEMVKRLEARPDGE
jgi:hypothetical protein